MSEWEPMETAPVGGGDLLLLTIDSGPVRGRFRSGSEGEQEMSLVAWRETSSGTIVEPFVWMHLPEPQVST